MGIGVGNSLKMFESFCALGSLISSSPHSLRSGYVGPLFPKHTPSQGLFPVA